MSLIRWEPFSGIDEFLNRMPGALGRWPRAFEGNGSNLFDWSPSVEISENDTEYLIRADLPAVRKEDVHVTLDDSMLTISGERKQRTEDKTEKSHRVETAYGKFSRSFSLPDTADGERVEAKLDAGVLTLTIWKKAEAKPRKIALRK